MIWNILATVIFAMFVIDALKVVFDLHDKQGGTASSIFCLVILGGLAALIIWRIWA